MRKLGIYLFSLIGTFVGCFGSTAKAQSPVTVQNDSLYFYDRSIPLAYGFYVTGWYVQPEAQVVFYDGNRNLMAGLHTGFVCNNNLYIGLGFVRNVKDNQFDIVGRLYGVDTTLSTKLNLGYFPFTVEPSIRFGKVVNVTLPFRFALGYGSLRLQDRSTPVGFSSIKDYEDLVLDEHEALFFLFEPGLNFEFKLQKHIRLDLGAHYRFISNWLAANNGIPVLNGFSFSGGIRFGDFRKGKPVYYEE